MRILPLATVLAACILASPPSGAQTPPRPGFVASYQATDDASHAEVRAHIQSGGFLEQLATYLNRWIRLPRAVTLQLAECQESGVEYDAAAKTVNACYRTFDRFQGLAQGETDLRAASGAIHFMLTHGAAHAMVDVLALPQSARSEEGVYQLTALLLVNTYQMAETSLRGVQRVMELDTTWAQWGYARRHQLTAERLRGLACLVYGSAPEREAARFYAGLRESGLVSAARAPRCRAEHIRVIEVWGVRLDRYFHH
ncbi:MAG TPA: DUF4344 domain-containing metallopeptidase [Longimicrobium sp.]|nr:DUF4344 domain-containing metallopeptidase [Longimicrobium sp.]